MFEAVLTCSKTRARTHTNTFTLQTQPSNPFLNQSLGGIEVPELGNDFPHVDKSQHGDVQLGEQPFGYLGPGLSNNHLAGGVAGILLARLHKEQLTASTGETEEGGGRSCWAWRRFSLLLYHTSASSPCRTAFNSLLTPNRTSKRPGPAQAVRRPARPRQTRGCDLLASVA